jgi:hypothetical protein
MPAIAAWKKKRREKGKKEEDRKGKEVVEEGTGT